MNVKIGDMWSTWDDPDTLFCVTTNSVVRLDGELMMGRGIAKAIRERVPDLAALSGKIINLQSDPDNYGLIILDIHGRRIGLFQVKRHFKESADTELISAAVTKLCSWCAAHPDVFVNLNFPGIGHGRLNESEVLPLLAPLPDQVTVWKFGKPAEAPL